MIVHKPIRSKMKKTLVLAAHPLIAQHVPETVWYSALNLKTMLARYGTIYIKPNAGNQGNRVMRVQKINEHYGILADNRSSKTIKLAHAPSKLKKITKGSKYIIQQGIDKATYRSCPFDIRIVMQKPFSTWSLTLTSAKVALRENAVVTNVAQGARDYSLYDILQVYDQRKDPLATLKELVDLAHQMSAVLGAKLPLRIIGFDMAVDKKGKVWFIEANTNPQCARCKLVNDAASKEKYERARTIIKSKLK